jgi:hypothetical protein
MCQKIDKNCCTALAIAQPFMAVGAIIVGVATLLLVVKIAKGKLSRAAKIAISIIATLGTFFSLEFLAFSLYCMKNVCWKKGEQLFIENRENLEEVEEFPENTVLELETLEKILQKTENNFNPSNIKYLSEEALIHLLKKENRNRIPSHQLSYDEISKRIKELKKNDDETFNSKLKKAEEVLNSKERLLKCGIKDDDERHEIEIELLRYILKEKYMFFYSSEDVLKDRIIFKRVVSREILEIFLKNSQKNNLKINPNIIRYLTEGTFKYLLKEKEHRSILKGANIYKEIEKRIQRLTNITSKNFKTKIQDRVIEGEEDSWTVKIENDNWTITESSGKNVVDEEEKHSKIILTLLFMLKYQIEKNENNEIFEGVEDIK